MVQNGKSNGPLEPGVYLIQSVAASSPLNLVRHKEGQSPSVCHWRTFKSPTERWVIERGEEGYRFQNASTSLYLSIQGDKPKSFDTALGLESAVEWIIDEKEPATDRKPASHHVKLVSNPLLVLDVRIPWQGNGSEIIVCDDFHGRVNQQWTFHRLSDEPPPPPFTKQAYVGPVPAGLYWLGQSYEFPQSSDGKPIPRGQAPSTAALEALACVALEEGNVSYIHLSAVGDVQWPHQIWALEPGRRGYRLRNVGLKAYLSYFQSEPVLERISDGPISISEWSLIRDPESPTGDIVDWLIRPCADYNVVIGVSKGDTFNKLRARTTQAWKEEIKKGFTYRRWRLEPLEERSLDILSRLVSSEEFQKPH